MDRQPYLPTSASETEGSRLSGTSAWRTAPTLGASSRDPSWAVELPGA